MYMQFSHPSKSATQSIVDADIEIAQKSLADRYTFTRQLAMEDLHSHLIKTLDKKIPWPNVKDTMFYCRTSADSRNLDLGCMAKYESATNQDHVCMSSTFPYSAWPTQNIRLLYVLPNCPHHMGRASVRSWHEPLAHEIYKGFTEFLTLCRWKNSNMIKSLADPTKVGDAISFPHWQVNKTSVYLACLHQIVGDIFQVVMAVQSDLTGVAMHKESPASLLHPLPIHAQTGEFSALVTGYASLLRHVNRTRFADAQDLREVAIERPQNLPSGQFTTFEGSRSISFGLERWSQSVGTRIGQNYMISEVLWGRSDEVEVYEETGDTSLIYVEVALAYIFSHSSTRMGRNADAGCTTI
ncbi:hypothetical protein WOLCODRAFT_17928 [Wolfiporia cocos MD-104 SS10]|uniref:Uncharacterized protein n=1 Tax=Wolfiporia cocos (strain MD-104) TaxID=742152 RepID=A0A2H3K181_WOLCO|nr:hypothetical protein WOLCODRAFT_17928 [Wolfiporia cocos MD-104 SS10]